MASQTSAEPTEPSGPRHPWPLRLRVGILVGCGAILLLSLALLFLRSSWASVAGIGIGLSSMAIGQLGGLFFAKTRMRPAMRRYQLRLSVTMIIYLAALFGSLALYQHGLTKGPIGYLVALAPAAPIVAFFVIIGLFLKEETDELMRRIVMESMLWAGALTLAEATVWGFLETFGKVPNVWMWAVTVAFFAQLGVTAVFITRKYR